MKHRITGWLVVASFALLIFDALVDMRGSAQAQTVLNPVSVAAAISQFGLFQLPKCPGSGTYLYFTSVPTTGPRLYGCAALGVGLTLNTSTNPPQIVSAAAPLSYTYGEVPGGAIDGTNQAFTLAAAPNPPASLLLFRNMGAQVAGTDYTLAGSTLTFTFAPQVGDIMMAIYRTQ